MILSDGLMKLQTCDDPRANLPAGNQRNKLDLSTDKCAACLPACHLRDRAPTAWQRHMELSVQEGGATASGRGVPGAGYGLAGLWQVGQAAGGEPAWYRPANLRLNWTAKNWTGMD